MEAALVHIQDALIATPEGHPMRAKRLNILSNYLNHQYNRTGKLQDLEAAIVHAQAAVTATSEHPPDRGKLLNNLAYKLSERH